MHNKIKPIKFKNVGRKQQHEITLFAVGEREFDFEGLKPEQSFAEETLTHIHMQALRLLKERGIESVESLYYLNKNKEIVVWKQEEDSNELDRMILVSAIEKRDKLRGGQTGEYLAALIDQHCRTLLNGGWPPLPENHSAVLDLAMEIQDLFFKLYLLENIHPKYSAGNSRVDEAHDERNLTHFKPEAEAIYISCRKNRVNKKNSYAETASELKRRHPTRKTPKAGTISAWFKRRKDLP